MAALESLNSRASRNIRASVSMRLSNWVQWSPRVPQKSLRDPLQGVRFRKGGRVLSGIIYRDPRSKDHHPWGLPAKTGQVQSALK